MEAAEEEEEEVAMREFWSFVCLDWIIGDTL